MTELKRILQIDDDATYYDITRHALSSDFHVELATSYESGMSLLKTESYDLILVNMNLKPKLDILGSEKSDRLGGEILDYIQNNLPGTPRIVITGDDEEFSGAFFTEYSEIYKVKALFRKQRFKGFHLRDAINKALQIKKLFISVSLRHARLSRYLAHYYQRDALGKFPRLQLIEIEVNNPQAEETEITIVFSEQPPYIQETVHTIKVPPGKLVVSLSPVFTSNIAENAVIATNLSIKEKNQVIWKTENSLLIEVVETIPIILKQVATGDQWMHFLIVACITPNSEEVIKLSGEVRDKWRVDYPEQKWSASSYTQQNALEIAKILRALLQERLTLEGVYIPSVPNSPDIVEHVMRLPDEILKNRGANCLYYSLLYASVLENLGINPVLLFMPGHVVPGWKKHSSPAIDIRDIAKPETRKTIDEECVFIESTGTSLKEYSFDQLIETGRRISANAQELYLREMPVSVSAVDVSDLRSKGLKPFNFRGN